MGTYTTLYRSIVVGTDGSDSASEAVRHAVQLSGALGATLHIVSAAKNNPAENTQETLDRLLDGVAAEARADGIEVMTHGIIGNDPADAILQVAAHRDADLIILGNRGMAGISRLLGSVPNKVSHNAKCSVAIIRTT